MGVAPGGGGEPAGDGEARAAGGEAAKRPEPEATDGAVTEAAGPAPSRRVPRHERPIPEPMPLKHVAIVAVFVAVLYAVGMIARGQVMPGIVGGILAGVLLFLVFREVGERQRRRIRARERSLGR